MTKRLIKTAFLLALLVGAISQPLLGQTSSPLSLSLGTTRTEAEAAAVRLAVRYFENFGEKRDAGPLNPGAFSYFYQLKPDVTIQTGDEDTFNGVVAKMTGHLLLFNTTTVAGAPAANSAGAFHVLPVSFGFESDRRFEKISGLAEIGWMPWTAKKHKVRLGKHIHFGLFAQGGYKFKVDSAPTTAKDAGGAADQSSEAPETAIFRLKSTLGFELPLMTSQNPHVPRALMDSAGWYDIKNNDFYHRIEFTLRFPLTDKQSFDLKYEHGSGAPNFNEGDQFSANLNIKF